MFGVLAVALAGCLPPAAPPIPAPPPSPPAQVAAPTSDYASDAFSDPWDFSNAEDFNVTPDAQAVGLGNVALTNGWLHFDTPGGAGYFDLAHSIAGSIATGRDTRAHPIDAGVYTALSFSMRSTAADNTSGQILWFTCPELSAACQGNIPFFKTGGGGFAQYNVNLTGSHGGVPWAGTIYGIRIIPSAAPATQDWDWVRLHTAASPAAPPANPAPLPVIDNPSAAGGADYANTTRGFDPWDFSQPSDVWSTANMMYVVGYGILNGINTGPAPWDPQIELSLGPNIDGAKYHHVTIRVWYGGGFSLANAPGGGMVARLVWTVAGRPSEPQDSDDVVVYPGWNTIQFDMATNPVSAIVDPNTPFAHYGWYGQQITSLRFDPDEDPGPRQFIVDDIRLTADAQGATGYPITFHDNAWEPGTTAEVWAQAQDGSTHQLGSLAMTGPSATFNWSGAPAGTWYVYVVLHDPSGQTGLRYASGPLQIG
jgi:hypothetical protein